MQKSLKKTISNSFHCALLTLILIMSMCHLNYADAAESFVRADSQKFKIVSANGIAHSSAQWKLQAKIYSNQVVYTLQNVNNEYYITSVNGENPFLAEYCEGSSAQYYRFDAYDTQKGLYRIVSVATGNLLIWPNDSGAPYGTKQLTTGTVATDLYWQLDKKPSNGEVITICRNGYIRATGDDEDYGIIPASNRTVYVSLDGNDGNDGSTPEKAIKTIDRLNSLIEEMDITAGDKILFRKGDAFTGEINLSNKFGSNDNHIYIGSYGEDTELANKQITELAAEDWDGPYSYAVWRFQEVTVDSLPYYRLINVKTGLLITNYNGTLVETEDLNGSDSQLWEVKQFVSSWVGQYIKSKADGKQVKVKSDYSIVLEQGSDTQPENNINAFYLNTESGSNVLVSDGLMTRLVCIADSKVLFSTGETFIETGNPTIITPEITEGTKTADIKAEIEATIAASGISAKDYTATITNNYENTDTYAAINLNDSMNITIENLDLHGRNDSVTWYSHYNNPNAVLWGRDCYNIKVKNVNISAETESRVKSSTADLNQKIVYDDEHKLVHYPYQGNDYWGVSFTNSFMSDNQSYDNAVFENVTVTGSLGFAVDGTNMTLKNCKVYDSPAWGITVTGDYVQVVGCETNNTGYGSNPSGNAAYFVMNSSYVTFDDCSAVNVHDGTNNKYGQGGLAASGDWSGYTSVKWRMQETKVDGKTYYRFVNTETGKVLTNCNGVLAEAYLGQYNNDEQLWEVKQFVSGWTGYYIKSKVNGKQLKVKSDNSIVFEQGSDTQPENNINAFFLHTESGSNVLASDGLEIRLVCVSGSKFLYSTGTFSFDTTVAYDGVAFDFEANTNYVTLKNSYFKNTDGPAIMVFGTNNKNYSIENCYVENYCLRDAKGPEGAINFFNNYDTKGHNGTVNDTIFLKNGANPYFTNYNNTQSDPNSVYNTVEFNNCVFTENITYRSATQLIDLRKYLLGVHERDKIVENTADLHSDNQIDILDLVRLKKELS